MSDYLNGGVTCASAADCWAVGEYEDATFCSHPLIEHWDGTSWSIATSPDPGPESVLNSVTCAAASDCWAVGSGSTQALIEHWDGTSWSIVTPPSPLGAQFFGVTCTSAADCSTVGYYNLNSGSATLIEHWDGTSWSIVASGNPGPKMNHLYGVTCASTGRAGPSATSTSVLHRSVDAEAA